MNRPDPTVELTSGVVQGRRVDGVELYRAIPFAAPPVGERRWCAPEPVAGWSGVRDGRDPAPMALQNHSTFQQLLGTQRPEMSEDCLTLDVWTSGATGPPRPVMVWIHGGTFLTGTGSSSWYDGRALVARGVVLVCPNYRLGALGFLHLAGLDGGDDATGSGNLGLLDQVAALRWIRDHIGAFGGDPAQVTVFGESAGAMSIGALLAVPAARGLLHRAVLQSGAASNVADAESAERVTAELIGELEGSGDPLRSVGDLRGLPVERLLDAQLAVSRRAGWLRLAFQPVIDGVVLTEHPLDAVAAGSAAGVDLLIGVNAEEMRLFPFLDPSLDTSRSGLLALATAALGDDAPGVVDAYRQTLEPTDDLELWVAVVGDAAFTVPADRLARAQVQGGATVYQYWFDWAGPGFGGALGSCHVTEVPFVFGSLDAPGVELFLGPADDAMWQLSSSLGEAWTTFARGERPSAAGMAAWPPWDPIARPTAVLGPELATGPHPRAALLDRWPD